jgi:hypothetical protein
MRKIFHFLSNLVYNKVKKISKIWKGINCKWFTIKRNKKKKALNLLSYNKFLNSMKQIVTKSMIKIKVTQNQYKIVICKVNKSQWIFFSNMISNLTNHSNLNNRYQNLKILTAKTSKIIILQLKKLLLCSNRVNLLRIKLTISRQRNS